MSRRAFAVALLLAAAGCGRRDADPAAPPPPIRVALTAPRPIEVAREIAVTGELAAFEELALGFEVPGRIVRQPPEVGLSVAADAELAALEPIEFELGRARARAALAAARTRLGVPSDRDLQQVDIEVTAPVREALAVLADAERERGRARELAQQEFQSQAVLDAAEAAWAVAESRLQRARDEARTWIAELELRQVELAQAEERLRDAVLRAPWAGRVASREGVVGRFAQAGETIVTLLRTDPLRLRLRVPERQAHAVRIGQRVNFTVDGDDAAFDGTVARLGAAIDPLTRTLLVEAEVENGEDRLLPGGFCRARIVVAEAEPALAVPAAAVQSFAGVDRVFTVESGKAVGILVETGRRFDGEIEIRTGLAPDRPIVRDARELRIGAAVVVAE